MGSDVTSSRLRRPLLWVWLALCLLMIAYLCTPFFAPTIIRFALREMSGGVENCDLGFLSLGRLRAERCVLTWPTKRGAARVQAEGVYITFLHPLSWPSVALDALTVRLPDEQEEAPRQTDASYVLPLLPFSELSIGKVILFLGREGSLRSSLHIVRESDGVSFEAGLEEIHLPPYLQTDKLDLEGNIVADGSDSLLTIRPKVSADWKLGVGSCSLKGGGSTFQDGIDVRLAGGPFSGEGGAIEIDLPSLECPATNVSATRLSIDAFKTDEAGKLILDLRLIDTEVEVGKTKVPLGEAKVAAIFEAGKVRGTVRNEKDELVPDFEATFEHDFAEKKGKAEVKLPAFQLDTKRTLGALVKTEGSPLELTSGELSGNGDFSWNDSTIEPRSRASITMRGVGGTLFDASFTGTEGTLRLTGFPAWHSDSPAEMRVEGVGFGISAENMVLKITMKKSATAPSDIVIEDAFAELFEGTARVPRFELKSGKVLPFTIELDQIDLTAVLKLAGESVEGSGKLSGRIPVESRPEGFVVENGEVSALPPGGSLRYVPSAETIASAVSNAGLDLALRALDQFVYEKLDSKLQYHTDGALHADVSLFGSNPQLFNGRKVQFNINIEENIPSLLKSLRFATKAEQEVFKPQS